MEVKKMTWQVWLNEGDQIFKPAVPKKKSKFSTVIRYNLLSISLENYIMAILDYFQNLPLNHTYTDLLDALGQVIPLEENLKRRILQYENIQSICSVEKYSTTEPTEDELTDLAGAILEIKKLAHATCIAISTN